MGFEADFEVRLGFEVGFEVRLGFEADFEVRLGFEADFEASFDFLSSFFVGEVPGERRKNVGVDPKMNTSQESSVTSTTGHDVVDRPIVFYTHTYSLVEVSKGDKRLYVFGLTAERRPVIALVKGWITTLDVKVRLVGKLAPLVYRNALEEEKNKLLSVINQVNEDEESTFSIVGHEYVDLDYYHQWSPTKSKFHRLRVEFDNYADFDSIKKALSIKGYQMTDGLQHESRFRFDYNIRPTQWISLTNTETVNVNYDISERRPIRVAVDAADIRAIDDAEMTSVEIPVALIATFDIETFSSLYARKCHPNKNLPRDVIYAISYVLSWSDTKIPFRKQCIVACSKEVGDVKVDDPTIEVIQVKDEEAANNKLAWLINVSDPDSIVSYNGMGYDFDYIRTRSQEQYEGFPAIGRVQNSSYEKFVDFEWKGAGNSYHNHVYPKAFGRVVIDSMVVAIRVKIDEIGHNFGEYHAKKQAEERGLTKEEAKAIPRDNGPRSHKLDDVGEFYTGEHKIGLSYEEQYTIYAEIEAIENGKYANAPDLEDRKKTALANLGKVVDYCVQDSVLCAKVFYEMKTWVECRESASIVFQDMNDFFITGQTRKLMELIFRKLRERGFYAMATRMKTPAFGLKGGYVGKPRIGLVEDACVVDFASMYPSMVQMYNIDPSSFVPNLRGLEAFADRFLEVRMHKQVSIPSMPADYEVPLSFDFERFAYNKEIIKENPNMAYNREYVENIMEEEGYKKEYLEAFVNEICEVFKKPVIYEGKEEDLIVYFDQTRQGISSDILTSLGATRKAFKKLMESAPNQTIKDIYDRRQNAIKIVMNSYYGFFGSREGDYGFMEGAAAITHFGRLSIGAVNEYLEANNADIVYGDTDSSFFVFRQPFAKDAAGRALLIVKTDELVKGINEDLLRRPLYPGCEKAIGLTSKKYPVKMELEKIMDVLLIAKKKYIGRIGIADSQVLPKPKSIIRGIALARGDTLPFVKVVYKKLIAMLFPPKIDEVEIDPVETKKALREYYDEQMAMLKAGTVDRNLLVMSKKLGSDYSSTTAPMAVYARYLQENNMPADAGTRLDFVVIEGTGSVGQRYRPVDTAEPIDYGYYLKLAINPLEQFIESL